MGNICCIPEHQPVFKNLNGRQYPSTSAHSKSNKSSQKPISSMKIQTFNQHGKSFQEEEIDSNKSCDYYSCRSLKDSRLLEFPLDNTKKSVVDHEDQRFSIPKKEEESNNNKRPFWEKFLNNLRVEETKSETVQVEIKPSNYESTKPLQKREHETSNDEEFYEAHSYFAEDYNNNKESESCFSYDPNETKQIENVVNFEKSFENELEDLFENKNLDQFKFKYLNIIEDIFQKIKRNCNDKDQSFQKTSEGEISNEEFNVPEKNKKQDINRELLIKAEWNIPFNSENFLGDLNIIDFLKTIKNVERIEEEKKFITNNGEIYFSYNLSFKDTVRNQNYILERACRKLDDQRNCEIVVFESNNISKESSEYQKEDFSINFLGILVSQGSKDAKERTVHLFYNTTHEEDNFKFMENNISIADLKKFSLESAHLLGRQ